MEMSASAREPWELVSEIRVRGDRDELHLFLDELSPGETARLLSRLDGPAQALLLSFASAVLPRIVEG
ncbi:MAG: hypothetical protein O2930_03300 [Acidobacteria bacterium]|nr:hypothetical protein [Acidobacteriota bacterium]